MYTTKSNRLLSYLYPQTILYFTSYWNIAPSTTRTETGNSRIKHPITPPLKILIVFPMGIVTVKNVHTTSLQHTIFQQTYLSRLSNDDMCNKNLIEFTHNNRNFRCIKPEMSDSNQVGKDQWGINFEHRKDISIDI